MAKLIRVIDEGRGRCELCQKNRGALYKLMVLMRYVVKECKDCGRLYIYHIEEGGA